MGRKLNLYKKRFDKQVRTGSASASGLDSDEDDLDDDDDPHEKMTSTMLCSHSVLLDNSDYDPSSISVNDGDKNDENEDVSETSMRMLKKMENYDCKCRLDDRCNTKNKHKDTLNEGNERMGRKCIVQQFGIPRATQIMMSFRQKFSSLNIKYSFIAGLLYAFTMSSNEGKNSEILSQPILSKSPTDTTASVLKRRRGSTQETSSWGRASSKYYIMQKRLCREGFCTIVGISSRKLTDIVSDMKKESHQAPFQDRPKVSRNKPKKAFTEEAIRFITDYGTIHGRISSKSGRKNRATMIAAAGQGMTYLLPSQTLKKHVFDEFVRERDDAQDILNNKETYEKVYARFLTIWGNYCSNFKIEDARGAASLVGVNSIPAGR